MSTTIHRGQTEMAISVIIRPKFHNGESIQCAAGLQNISVQQLLTGLMLSPLNSAGSHISHGKFLRKQNKIFTKKSLRQFIEDHKRQR